MALKTRRCTAATARQDSDSGFDTLCEDLEKYAPDQAGERRTRGLWTVHFVRRDPNTGGHSPGAKFVFYRTSARDNGQVLLLCPFCGGKLNESSLARQAKRESEASVADDGWLPISTAPREGEVLVLVKRAGLFGRMVAHHMDGGHCIEDHPPVKEGWYHWTGHCMAPLKNEPTHWRPLPPGPVST